METRRDLLLAVLVLAAASLGLAFVSIGLFVRMSPATDESVIATRLESLEATHALVGVFARRWGEAVDQAGVARLGADLERLRKSVADDERGKLLVSNLTDATGRALFGEHEPLSEFVEAAGEIVHERVGALRADLDHAARLGSAGAWAAALGGLGLTVLGLLVYLRLERRIARPARELSRVLGAARSGDLMQRCRAIDGTSELEQALATVNVLLDKVPALAPDIGPGASPEAGPRPVDELARQALVRLLDREPGAVVLWSLPGGLVAASGHALDRLGADATLRERLALAVADGGSQEVTVEPLEPGRLLLLRIA